MTPEPALPLADLSVLDLSQGVAGAYCSTILIEMGAQVVKCEPPGGEWLRSLAPTVDGTPAIFAALNAGKRSIVVDLKRPEGVELVRGAISKFDVLIESLRPGVLERLGLGTDVIQRTNPKLVHTSITGFGQDGPWSDRPAVDIIAQALGGLLAVTGPRDGEPVRAPLVADLHCGALAAVGSLARLYAGGSGEPGGRVDANLVESVLGMQRSGLAIAALTGKAPSRAGSDAEYAAPNGAFKARDGHIAVAANMAGRWESFCEVIGRPDLVGDERFADNELRAANASALRAEIEEALRDHSVSALAAALGARDVPCAPVIDVVEAASSPHFRARGRFRRVRLAEGLEVDFPAVSPAVSPEIGLGSEASVESPPRPGEHSREILAEWGLESSEVQALFDAGAVEAPAGL